MNAQAPADTSMPMPFGKHKGVAIEDLPCHYLRWATEEIQASPRNMALLAALRAEQEFRVKSRVTVKEAGGEYLNR